MKFIYKGFTYLYTIPLAAVILALRMFGNRSQCERLGIGLPKLAAESDSIWFVASSVGEVAIGIKIIERLRASSSANIILTVTTKTGKQHALSQNVKADIVSYHPFDLSFAVRRFISAYRPKKIVLIETELWPVLLEEAHTAGISVIQVSGRISAKSLRRYLPFKPYLGPLLSKCDKFMMQSEADADRIREIIGESDKVISVGSIKIDYTPPDQAALDLFKELLRAWNGELLFTCGSTRPREEEILLQALRTLKEKGNRWRFVVAPRHLDRVNEIVGLAAAAGVQLVKRSESSPTKETELYLLDTIGELNLAYHCSNAAFVGGTIAPIGGHNLLEPALAGCPVIYGPHCENQLASRAMLEKYDLGSTVTNSEEIVHAITRIGAKLESGGNYLAEIGKLRTEGADLMNIYLSEITKAE